MAHHNEIQLLCTFPWISEMMDSLHWLISPTSRISCGPAKTPASALVRHWVSKAQPDTVHCPESACFPEEGPRRVSKGGILKAMDLEWSQFFMGWEKWHLFGFDAVTTRLCLLLDIFLKFSHLSPSSTVWLKIFFIIRISFLPLFFFPV